MGAQLCGKFLGGFQDGGAGFLLGQHGQDDDLRRCNTRRKNKAVIIGVRHDERADEPRAHSPAGGPGELTAAIARGKLDPGGAGEVLSEEMRSARLDRLAVLHHGFDAKRADSPREALAFRFFAGEDGKCEMLAGECFVDAEHFVRLGHSLFHRLVRRVSLLPEEFRRAEKKTRPHFPADHIGPLVDEQRQVAIRLHPAGVGRTDDGFGCRADDERFGQFTSRDQFAVLFLEPVVRDDSAFLGKAFDVLGFFFEEAQRDEEREVGVDVSGRLEHGVQLALHVLPNPPAPRFDDHAAADIGIFREIGGLDDLLIPFGKVVGAGRSDSGLHEELRVEGRKLRERGGVYRERRLWRNFLKNSTPRSKAATSMNSSSVWAWAMDPGPMATAGVPAAEKMAASQNQAAPAG